VRRLPNGRRACQGLALGERATRVLLCDCFPRSTLALGGCQASPYTHASASRIHSSSGLLLWAPLHGLGAVGAPESWYRATAVRRGIPSRLPVVLRGQSTVCVNDIAAICEWLADCEYVRDPVHERDFWQHPKTFEQLRKGDCEDHALWAWRKLTELGIPADAHRSSKRLSSALCDRRAIQFRRVWRLYAIPETGTR